MLLHPLWTRRASTRPMLDLAHNPMADQRAEYGRETRYSQVEVVADVFFGGMAQVSNVLAPSTECYALFSLVMCDEKGVDLEVITWARLLIPWPEYLRSEHLRSSPGVCKFQDAVGSSQVTNIHALFQEAYSTGMTAVNGGTSTVVSSTDIFLPNCRFMRAKWSHLIWSYVGSISLPLVPTFPRLFFG